MKKHKLVSKDGSEYSLVEMTEQEAAKRNARLEAINDSAQWVPIVEDAQPSDS